MSRWLLIACLLCPACASGSAPTPGDKTISKVEDPPGPVQPVDPAPPADPNPPANPDPGAGGGGNSSSGSSGDTDHDQECEALWEIAEHLGCGVVKLICAAVEALHVHDAEISCDVAVPLACGLASAAADAAIALCPHHH